MKKEEKEEEVKMEEEEGEEEDRGREEDKGKGERRLLLKQIYSKLSMKELKQVKKLTVKASITRS